MQRRPYRRRAVAEGHTNDVLRDQLYTPAAAPTEVLLPALLRHLCGPHTEPMADCALRTAAVPDGKERWRGAFEVWRKVLNDDALMLCLLLHAGCLWSPNYSRLLPTYLNRLDAAAATTGLPSAASESSSSSSSQDAEQLETRWRGVLGSLHEDFPFDMWALGVLHYLHVVEVFHVEEEEIGAAPPPTAGEPHLVVSPAVSRNRRGSSRTETFLSSPLFARRRGRPSCRVYSSDRSGSWDIGARPVFRSPSASGAADPLPLPTSAAPTVRFKFSATDEFSLAAAAQRLGVGGDRLLKMHPHAGGRAKRGRPAAVEKGERCGGDGVYTLWSVTIGVEEEPLRQRAAEALLLEWMVLMDRLEGTSDGLWFATALKFAAFVDDVDAPVVEENAHIAAVVARQGKSWPTILELLHVSIPSIFLCLLEQQAAVLRLPPLPLLLPFHLFGKGSTVRSCTRDAPATATAPRSRTCRRPITPSRGLPRGRSRTAAPASAPHTAGVERGEGAWEDGLRVASDGFVVRADGEAGVGLELVRTHRAPGESATNAAPAKVWCAAAQKDIFIAAGVSEDEDEPACRAPADPDSVAVFGLSPATASGLQPRVLLLRPVPRRSAADSGWRREEDAAPRRPAGGPNASSGVVDPHVLLYQDGRRPADPAETVQREGTAAAGTTAAAVRWFCSSRRVEVEGLSAAAAGAHLDVTVRRRRGRAPRVEPSTTAAASLAGAFQPSGGGGGGTVSVSASAALARDPGAHYTQSVFRMARRILSRQSCKPHRRAASEASEAVEVVGLLCVAHRLALLALLLMTKGRLRLHGDVRAGLSATGWGGAVATFVADISLLTPSPAEAVELLQGAAAGLALLAALCPADALLIAVGWLSRMVQLDHNILRLRSTPAGGGAGSGSGSGWVPQLLASVWSAGERDDDDVKKEWEEGAGHGAEIGSVRALNSDSERREWCRRLRQCLPPVMALLVRKAVSESPMCQMHHHAPPLQGDPMPSAADATEGNGPKRLRLLRCAGCTLSMEAAAPTAPAEAMPLFLCGPAVVRYKSGPPRIIVQASRCGEYRESRCDDCAVSVVHKKPIVNPPHASPPPPLRILKEETLAFGSMCGLAGLYADYSSGLFCYEQEEQCRIGNERLCVKDVSRSVASMASSCLRHRYRRHGVAANFRPLLCGCVSLLVALSCCSAGCAGVAAPRMDRAQQRGSELLWGQQAEAFLPHEVQQVQQGAEAPSTKERIMGGIDWTRQGEAGRVLYNRIWGWRSVSADVAQFGAQPLRIVNNFPIGLSSEFFVDVVAAHMNAHGLIPFHLDGIIPKVYLPPALQGSEYLSNPTYPDVPVSLQNLLQHTSSISDEGFDDATRSASTNATVDPAAQDIVGTNSEYVEQLFKTSAGSVWRSTRPGVAESFFFARNNIALATYILDEVLSRAPETAANAPNVAAYMTEILLPPIGCFSTFFLDRKGRMPSLSYPAALARRNMLNFAGVQRITSSWQILSTLPVHPAYAADFMLYTSPEDVRLLHSSVTSSDGFYRYLYDTLVSNPIPIPTEKSGSGNGIQRRTLAFYGVNMLTLCKETYDDCQVFDRTGEEELAYGIMAANPCNSVAVLCSEYYGCFYAFTFTSCASENHPNPFEATAIRMPMPVPAEVPQTAAPTNHLNYLLLFVGVMGIIITTFFMSYVVDHIVHPAPPTQPILPEPDRGFDGPRQDPGAGNFSDALDEEDDSEGSCSYTRSSSGSQSVGTESPSSGHSTSPSLLPSPAWTPRQSAPAFGYQQQQQHPTHTPRNTSQRPPPLVLPSDFLLSRDGPAAATHQPGNGGTEAEMDGNEAGKSPGTAMYTSTTPREVPFTAAGAAHHSTPIPLNIGRTPGECAMMAIALMVMMDSCCCCGGELAQRRAPLVPCFLRTMLKGIFLGHFFFSLSPSLFFLSFFFSSQRFCTTPPSSLLPGASGFDNEINWSSSRLTREMSGAAQLLEALQAAFNPSLEVRQGGDAFLTQFRESNPELFFTQCVELLVSSSCPPIGRRLAGFQFKTYLFLQKEDEKDPMKAHDEQYMKDKALRGCARALAKNPSIMTAILQSIADPEREIRKVCSSLVSLAVVEVLWPTSDVLMHLCTLLSQGQGNPSALDSVHGAMLTISKIVDDCIILLDAQQMVAPLIQTIVPYLNMPALGETAEALEVRLRALDATAIILEQAGMDFNSPSYVGTQSSAIPIIDACFANLQHPPSTAVAAKCISCIVLALAHESQIDDNRFRSILQLMIAATTQETAEEEVRIAAVLFWSAILHFPRFARLSEMQIEQIIPTLIKCMVYSDMEIGMLSGSENDWQVEDKEDDIRPRHYQSKVQSTQAEDDENDAEDEVEEWNLRRVSARTLDDISAYYGEPILLPTFRIIREWINPSCEWADPSQAWKYVEAAILALGAITEGCLHVMGPYLSDLASHLLSRLEAENTHFLVVCISFWACEQIIEFLVSVPDTLGRFMAQVLGRMQSPSKRIQESATTALDTLLGVVDTDALEPYVDKLIATCAACLPGFQLKNRLLLLETMGPLCDKLAPIIRYNDALVGQLLAPIGTIWTAIPDNSVLIFPVFNCMASVCGALGPVMDQQMVGSIFQRAYQQLVTHLQQLPTNDDSQEFVVTAADLLSGLMDGLGSSLEPYLAPHQGPFMQMIMRMLTDENSGVRQSGFALCGDISKSMPAYMQSSLQPFVQAALLNLQQPVTENNHAVISNLAWSVCNLLENEVSLSGVQTLAGSPFLAQLYESMEKLLVESDITVDMRNMADNIVLALGIMISMDPQVITRVKCRPVEFSRRFCEYMRNVKMEGMPQKNAALSGYLQLIQAAPQVVADHIGAFMDLAVSLYGEPADTIGLMGRALKDVAAAAPPAWQAALQSNEGTERRKALHQIYGRPMQQTSAETIKGAVEAGVCPSSALSTLHDPQLLHSFTVCVCVGGGGYLCYGRRLPLLRLEIALSFRSSCCCSLSIDECGSPLSLSSFPPCYRDYGSQRYDAFVYTIKEISPYVPLAHPGQLILPRITATLFLSPPVCASSSCPPPRAHPFPYTLLYA
eukprot:gene12120-8343_t